MKKIFALYAAALLLSACEYTFEPKLDVNEDRMYVQAYVTDADTTFVRVSRTVPLEAAKSSGTDYRVEDFSVRADGEEVALQRKDDWRWYFLGHNAPGTTLDLYIKAAGVDAASARTVVPVAPKIASVASEHITVKERELQKITLTLAEDPDPDTYYALAYFLKEDLWWTTVVEGEVESDAITHVSSLYPTSLTEPEGLTGLLEEASRTIFSFLPSWDYRDGTAQLLVLSGREIQDRTIEQYYLWYGPFEQEYSWEDGSSYWTKSEYAWSVKLYRLSGEAYSYLMARKNEDYSELAMFGLIPPGFTYSNISGGYGVFASLGVTETPWKYIPAEQ